MIDLSQFGDRLTEQTQETLTLAIEETQRRSHYELRPVHLLYAMLRSDSWLLEHLSQALGQPPRNLIKTVQVLVEQLPTKTEQELQVPVATKQALQLAWDFAQSQSRSAIYNSDILRGLLETAELEQWLTTLSLNKDDVLAQLGKFVERRGQRERDLKKKYDLPPYLKQFATNLNREAALDNLPQLIGRQEELRQMIEILCHRERSNSVILLGEAGVGKTALAEGLAQMIEDQPESLPMTLRNRQIINLQMNGLVAGTMFRGMFEDRVEKILKELRSRNQYIVFIDEIHTIIGAGMAMGVPADAANIFKSALARGELQVIGATTSSEYKRFIAEDEALARRFRLVQVKEPSVEDALTILQGIRPTIERQYGVTIEDETLRTTIELSQRYNRHLNLPDKAIGWLHTACVRVEIAKPGGTVRPADIVAVIADDAQIPHDMVFRSTGKRFVQAEEFLAGRVLGQSEAIAATVRRLQMNKGPLKENFSRPDAVLLYLGPTGVGKTELAKSLAAFLFGDEKKMVRIDMSEYQEGTVGIEKLIGMPRGIVGSEQGGILTNALRDQPCTVVLLDEIEKAHPLLVNLFLQVFDEGWLTDGRGKRVYFSDAVIVMTSNLGSEEFSKAVSPLGFAKENIEFPSLSKNVLRIAEQRFSPEFLNRIDDIIVFRPLNQDHVRQIAANYIMRLQEQMKAQHKELHVDEAVIDYCAKIGFSPKYGARFLKRRIDEKLKLPLSLKWEAGDHFYARVQDGQVVIESTADLVLV